MENDSKWLERVLVQYVATTDHVIYDDPRFQQLLKKLRAARDAWVKIWRPEPNAAVPINIIAMVVDLEEYVKNYPKKKKEAKKENDPELQRLIKDLEKKWDIKKK